MIIGVLVIGVLITGVSIKVIIGNSTWSSIIVIVIGRMMMGRSVISKIKEIDRMLRLWVG